MKYYIGIPFIFVIIASAFILGRKTAPIYTDFSFKLHKHYQRLARNINNETTVFIGSSSIQSLVTSNIIKNSISLGIGGEKITQTITRVDEYPLLPTAKNIVLAIGFNDLCHMRDTQIVEYYQVLLSKFKPQQNIFISGLQPAPSLNVCKGLAEKIASFNNQIEKVCDALKHCRYIDLVNAIQKNAFNRDIPISKYFESDNIHLNNNGYLVWQELFKDSFAQLDN